MPKEPKDGKYRYHLNVQLTPWEHEHLSKFCTGYGAKNKLVRALIRRFFTEQGILSPTIKGEEDVNKVQASRAEEC